MNSDFPGGNPAAGGRCVTHPDNLAGGTCSRCGNFLCYVDTEGGRFTTCDACRARTGISTAFPLNRANYNFGALWDYCWGVFKQHWLMLSVGMLIPFAAVFVMSFVIQLIQMPFLMAGRGEDGGGAMPAVGLMIFSFVMMFVLYGVLGVIMMGYFRMVHDVLDGGQPDIGRLFSQFRKTGTLIVSGILMILGYYLVAAITLGPAVAAALLLKSVSEGGAIAAAVLLGGAGVFALLYLILPFTNWLQEVAYADGVGPIQVLLNCWRAAEGFRLQIVLVSLASIPIAIAGLLACCVGIIPAYALIFLLMTGIHRAIRTGAEGVIPQ